MDFTPDELISEKMRTNLKTGSLVEAAFVVIALFDPDTGIRTLQVEADDKLQTWTMLGMLHSVVSHVTDFDAKGWESNEE